MSDSPRALRTHLERAIHRTKERDGDLPRPLNNDPLQILMQWGGVFPDYFTNLRAGGGMMKEFARRLDEDGRTSQYPTTLKHDDRNRGYFDEAEQMVLKGSTRVRPS